MCVGNPLSDVQPVLLTDNDALCCGDLARLSIKSSKELGSKECV